MKKYLSYFFLVTLLTLTACEESEPRTSNVVTQFVYDGMSSVYYWNKEIIDKKPTNQDSNPIKYFNSILNSTDIEHGWSWITDDVDALKAGFAGEGFEAGYSLGFVGTENKIFAYVKYVYDNTPAAKAGIERLNLIGEVNGRPITADKDGYIDNRIINALYGEERVTLSVYKQNEDFIEYDREVTIQPKKIHKNPILHSSIFQEGSKTIGYLVYNSYIVGYNTQLHEVFTQFKQAGVDELILDLRYNRGGDASASAYLASMIAPENFVKDQEEFAIFEYNAEIKNSIYKLGEYNDKEYPNPLTANLNLNNVYIIATSDSYSASELTTFCLKQFANVTHIGSKTGGKYTGSITVHAYEEEYGYPLYESAFFPKKKLDAADKAQLANWAIQPIVSIYTDSKGNDFIETNGLLPDIELTEGFGYISLWTPFGDPKDVLLGQALYEITGNEEYKPVMPEETRSSIFSSEKIKVKSISIADEIRKESVIIDSF